MTSPLTNLTYQPPHQPPYQPPHQPHLPASSPTSFTSLLTNLLYQPLPLVISKVGCKAKNHVYIWDLYPTIWGCNSVVRLVHLPPEPKDYSAQNNSEHT